MAPSRSEIPTDSLKVIEPPLVKVNMEPSVAVESFDSATADVKDMVQAMIRAGGCIIRNIVSQEDLSQIEAEVRPHLPADIPWGDVNDFFPTKTRRVTGVIGKSQTYTRCVPGNRIYRDICEELLSVSTTVWLGQRQETHTSGPQVNNTVVFSIMPGAKRQELHRDDMIHHNSPPATTAQNYEIGRDVSIGLFVAGTKTTKANGATRFIPGSHLWDRSLPPVEEEAFYAELNPGDGFVMFASAFHAGSANTTEDQERLIYSCFLTKGYLRQVRTIPVHVNK